MKIVVLGDSFTFGQGCSDTPAGSVEHPSLYCWSSLIQTQFSSQVDNRARPGHSNASIIESLHQDLTRDIDLIIFCASFDARIQIKKHEYNEYVSESIGPNWVSDRGDTQVADAIQQYYKHLYSDRIGRVNTITTLLAAYGAAKLLGADFFWSAPENFTSVPVATHVLDHLSDMQFLSMADFKCTRGERSVCGHPNNIGHLRYYNEIIVPSLKNKLQEHNEH